MGEPTRARAILESVWIIVGILAAMLLALSAYMLLKARETAREMSTEIEATLKDVRSVADNIRKQGEDDYWDARASAETTAVILKSTSDLVTDTNANLNGGTDSRGNKKPGLMLVAGTALEALAQATRALEQDADSTLGPASPAHDSLANLGILLMDLDSQVKSGGLKTGKVLDDLAKAAEDMDRVLADPAIPSTLGHLEGTSAHVESSAESVDLALAPLRKKATMLKTVIFKAIGLFRVVWKI